MIRAQASISQFSAATPAGSWDHASAAALERTGGAGHAQQDLCPGQRARAVGLLLVGEGVEERLDGGLPCLGPAQVVPLPDPGGLGPDPAGGQVQGERQWTDPVDDVSCVGRLEAGQQRQEQRLALAPGEGRDLHGAGRCGPLPAPCGEQDVAVGGRCRQQVRHLVQGRHVVELVADQEPALAGLVGPRTQRPDVAAEFLGGGFAEGVTERGERGPDALGGVGPQPPDDVVGAAEAVAELEQSFGLADAGRAVEPAGAALVGKAVQRGADVVQQGFAAHERDAAGGDVGGVGDAGEAVGGARQPARHGERQSAQQQFGGPLLVVAAQVDLLVVGEPGRQRLAVHQHHPDPRIGQGPQCPLFVRAHRGRLEQQYGGVVGRGLGTPAAVGPPYDAETEGTQLGLDPVGPDRVTRGVDEGHVRGRDRVRPVQGGDEAFESRQDPFVEAVAAVQLRAEPGAAGGHRVVGDLQVAHRAAVEPCEARPDPVAGDAQLVLVRPVGLQGQCDDVEMTFGVPEDAPGQRGGVLDERGVGGETDHEQIGQPRQLCGLFLGTGQRCVDQDVVVALEGGMIRARPGHRGQRVRALQGRQSDGTGRTGGGPLLHGGTALLTRQQRGGRGDRAHVVPGAYIGVAAVEHEHPAARTGQQYGRVEQGRRLADVLRRGTERGHTGAGDPAVRLRHLGSASLRRW
ncbi:hypothetical protein QFZ55_006654 [Streptomyces luteogriseus]|nr:hypothetical protein [Streptomyces luteogriseus]MDQ0717202.1 hypothetical protein [Streptomyces luteogriseus]